MILLTNNLPQARADGFQHRIPFHQHGWVFLLTRYFIRLDIIDVRVPYVHGQTVRGLPLKRDFTYHKKVKPILYSKMYSPIHYNKLFEFAFQPTERYATGQIEIIGPLHYCGVIMGAMASQRTSRIIVYSTVYSGTDEKTIKARRRWPLFGEFTGKRWIPRTNGQ